MYHFYFAKEIELKYITFTGVLGWVFRLVLGLGFFSYYNTHSFHCESELISGEVRFACRMQSVGYQ